MHLLNQRLTNSIVWQYLKFGAAGAVLLLVFCCSTQSYADIVTLDASQDTTIYSNLVNNNGGGHNFGISGFANNGNERRFLVEFDLASIAPGSIVNSVSLGLNVIQATSGGGNFQLFRVDTDWGEGAGVGNQGSGAAAGDATWNESQFGLAGWTGGVAGGSFFTPLLDEITIDSVGVATFNSSSNFVNAVQDIVDNPSQNFGFIIVGTDAGSALRFGSIEGGSASSLSVDFTAIPEPGSLGILGVLGAVVMLRRRRG